MYEEISSPVEALDKLLESPFKYFEFSCNHLEYWIKNGKSDEMIANIKEKLEDNKADLIQLHAPIFNFLEDEAAEKKLNWCEDALELAGHFDIPWVVMHPGSREGWQEDEELKEWVMEQNIEKFDRLLKVAEKEGTGIAVENMFNHKFGSSVSELDWLLNQFSTSNLGVCWDTGHANLVYEDQTKAFEEIKEKVVAVHIADNRGEFDDHLYPLKGSIDWEKLIPALHSLKGVPFNFEVPGERAQSPVEIRNLVVTYGYELADWLSNNFNR